MKKISLKIIILSLFAIIVFTAPAADKISKVPGYSVSFNTSVFSGYLDVNSSTRGLHYVFVQSIKGINNNDPVTLWLNGGPGCSSMLGFIQQIGPYYLQQGIRYKKGDSLTLNPYSWHRVSNLLFIQSPAGVGFSYNNQSSYIHTDSKTATDNFQAVLDFFKKFPQYKRNNFWIAGQSYAGKYIPDLAVLIDKYNQKQIEINKINLKGILVGNGVMTFQNNQLYLSQIDYMIEHSFVDPFINYYYDYDCHFDLSSPGCQYFQKVYQQNTEQLNPYNVYGYCFYNDSFITKNEKNKKSTFTSQQSILRKLVRENSNIKAKKKSQSDKYNGAPCAYFDGIFDYFNLNSNQFHAKQPDMLWNGPCNENIIYQINISGSMEQYRYLLSKTGRYSIALYNGDWDDVVPYRDTIKNLRALGLKETYLFQPWFTNKQHSGFTQVYSQILYVTFKGASHQVPQSKRAQALNFFSMLLNGFQFKPKKGFKKNLIKQQ